MSLHPLGARGSVGMPLGNSPVSFGAASWYEDAVLAYAAKGAASQAESYVNLVTPGTYNANPIVAPTWDSSGWLFNGTTQWLNTGYVIPSNSFTAIVRVSDIVYTGLNTFFGALATNKYVWIRIIGGNYDYINGGTSSLVKTGIPPSGVYAIAGATAYKDGYPNGTIPLGALPAVNCAVGAFAVSAVSAAQFYKGKITHFAIWNSTLSYAEVASKSAEIAAL